MMLKARTAHHWTVARAQASVIDPRTLAEMFAVIAADLEILLVVRRRKDGEVMKPLSERDRAILSRHAAGASFKEIAEALKVGVGTVRRIVEHVEPIHTRSRELLQQTPESLEGLRLMGA